MLKLMREKAGSWFIKIILGLIVLVFVFWGVGSFRSDRFQTVATVNGAPISIEDYRQAYNGLLEQYRQQFGGNIDENMLRMFNLEQQALDSLVDRSLIRQEAKRLGIRVTDEELVGNIRQMAAFQNNGAFDNRLYNQVLGMNRLTPESFEAMQRDSLLVGKMSAIVMDGVNVSEAEAREWYDWNHARVNLEYVRFASEDFADETASDEEIRAFYEANPESYRTEPRVKARFVAFRTEDFKARVEATEEEVAEYYETNPDEFNEPKTVGARHILFSLEEGSDPELVEEKRIKAEEVMKEARAGADFAELARTHSEGPSAEQGGDLGTFTRERMVAPFSEAAFSMEAGEISEPVRTQFGWHVIKVEAVNEATTTPLEQARESIVETLKGREAKRLAREAADSFVEGIFEGDTLESLAEPQELVVEETDFFTRSQGPRGLAGASAFSAAAFALDEGEIGEVLEAPDGFYAIQVMEKEASEIAPLEDVADRVRADFLRQRREERARQAAEAFLARLKGTDVPAGDADAASEMEPVAEADGSVGEEIPSAESPAEASPETPETAETGESETDVSAEIMATAEDVEAPEFRETGFFGRDESIPGIGQGSEISEIAFRLSEEAPYPESPVQWANGYFVFRFKERATPDPEGFADEMDDIKENLERRKQFDAFRNWLARAKERSEIVVKEGILN